VKEAVQETFRGWLRGHNQLSDAEVSRMTHALEALDEIRARQPRLPTGTVSDLIWEAREERLAAIMSNA
jgi:hypothetical protein